MRFIVIAALFWTISGCTTVEMVTRTYEPEKGGVFRVRANGTSKGKADWRAKGEQMAKDFCASPVRIVQESYGTVTTGNGVATQVNNATFFSADSKDFLYVTFKCDRSSIATGVAN